MKGLHNGRILKSLWGGILLFNCTLLVIFASLLSYAVFNYLLLGLLGFSPSFSLLFSPTSPLPSFIRVSTLPYGPYVKLTGKFGSFVITWRCTPHFFYLLIFLDIIYQFHQDQLKTEDVQRVVVLLLVFFSINALRSSLTIFLMIFLGMGKILDYFTFFTMNVIFVGILLLKSPLMKEIFTLLQF